MNNLPRSEFDEAVKDALRYYTSLDILAGSKLLATRSMKQRDSAVTPVQGLRAMLVETAETLFSNTRDEKIHRVIKLTYFTPAPKQEAAAERLGLSFSTYRRYLVAGVGRLTEYLWRFEQDTARTEPASSEMAEPAGIVGDCKHSTMRRPLSLIVLPFLNLSPDADFGYFVDGVVDNLMTDLYRALPDSFIVSRSTAFTYKDRETPVRQIGDELQVRYVVEGSVLADATRIRVNAQLVDAETDEHLWAERFDKDRDDVLRTLEEIVVRLARSVGDELLRNEARRCSVMGSPGTG